MFSVDDNPFRNFFVPENGYHWTHPFIRNSADNCMQIAVLFSGINSAIRWKLLRHLKSPGPFLINDDK